MLLLGAAATGACGGSASGTSEPAAAVQQVQRPEQIVLPLDAYLPSKEQSEVIARATQQVGRDCMRGLQVPWPVLSVESLSSAGPNDRRYGLLDPRDAAAYGYQNVRADMEDERARTVDAAQQPKRDSFLVWIGITRTVAGRPVPEGGCAAEAKRILSGGAAPADTLPVQERALQSYQRMLGDSRVREAQALWSGCMREAGLNYSRPDQASESDEWLSEPSSDKERAVATADVRCKLRHNLAGVYMAVETAYQQAVIERNGELLDTVRADLDRQLKSAAALTGAPEA